MLAEVVVAVVGYALLSSTGTDLGVPVEVLQQRLRRTTVVFLVSDFAQEGVLERPEVQLLAHRHDLVPVILQDPLEEELPKTRGWVRLRDLESGEERVLQLTRAARLEYAETVARRRQALIDGLYRLGMDHVYLRVGESYVDPLVRLFLTRKRQQR